MLTIFVDEEHFVMNCDIRSAVRIIYWFVDLFAKQLHNNEEKTELTAAEYRTALFASCDERQEFHLSKI